jgi:HEAT repeat protein
MFLPSWTLQIIVDNVFAHVLEHSGLTDRIRNQLGDEPVQKAFQDALGKALEHLVKEHPQWESDLFDASFLENEGAPILAQFLMRDGHPDPDMLAMCWADTLNIRHPEHRTILVRQLEPVAADFLDYLAHELKKEPELSELHNSRAFEQLASDLRAIRSKLGAEQATVGTRRDYLRWLIERNLYLDPRGTFQTQRQIQVRLDEVYISLRTQRDKTPGEVDRRLEEGEMAQLEWKMSKAHHSAEELEDQREHMLARLESHLLDAKNVPGEVITLAEAVNRHESLVILGDPGSGKSTLLRYLALKHAQASYAGRSEVGTGLGTARFPLLIRIADYAEHGIPTGKSLSNYLVDYFDMHECPRSGLADLLATELAAGNCLILLDGLDEIVNADDRRKVVERIEDFIRHHDNRPNRFVITSRIAGYRSAPIGDPFVHYTVQEMDEEQIRRFLERWCTAVEAAQTPDLSQEIRDITARKEIDGIIKAVQTSPGVLRLAANPLLLRTLALIHRTGAQLPQKRIELYKLAADTLARTWRIAQGVPESALVDEKYLTRLLGKLAYWLHENKATGIATEREVYRELGQEWARIKGLGWEEDHPDIESEIKKFLQAVREHTGLFVERAPRRYGFMHLTFEEYYAARYLVARSKDRAKLIRKHLHNPRWEEPILLAMGFVGLDSPEDAAELLETAIMAESEDAKESGYTRSKYEELLGRDYLFALRCLGDNIPARPGVTRQLVKRLISELLYQVGPARFQRYRQFMNERLKYLKGSEASSILLPLLVAAMRDPNLAARNRTAESLGRLGQINPEVITVLIEALHNADPHLSNTAAWSLGQLSHFSPEVVTALIGAMYDADPEMRYQAAKILGQSGQASPEDVAALTHALHDTNPDICKVAAQSLGQLGRPSAEVIRALIQVLRAAETDPHVRTAAAEGLGKLAHASPEAIKALIPALHDVDSDVRFSAMMSVQIQNASPEAVSALVAALCSTDLDLRCQLVRRLRLQQASPEVVTALIATLNDADPSALCVVASSLGQRGKVPGILTTALIAALHDTDPQVRTLSARNLGQLDRISPEAVTALIAALHDTDPQVRLQTAESLGEVDQAPPSETNAALIAALRDTNPSVRRAAIQSLGKLGQREASDEVVRALLGTLRDKVSQIRHSAVRSLGQLKQGQMANEVVASLFKTLHDKNSTVCLAAAESLGKMGYALPEIIGLERETIEDTATDWSVRCNAARLLGQIGQCDQPTIDILWRGLIDMDHDLRSASVQALVQLGRQFPNSAEIIERKLVQAIEDSEFDKRDWNNCTVRDHAYDALWLLVTGSEFERRIGYIS